MHARYIKIFVITLFGVSLLSCSKKDEDHCGDKLPSYLIMQRVKLVDKDGNWIEGIKDAKVELIAMDEDWKNPLFDKNGHLLKQVTGYVEARKSINSGSGVSWIELYMVHKDFFLNNGVSRSGSSHFILKVDDRSFKIETGYLLDFCRRDVLQAFYFNSHLYPTGAYLTSFPINITIEEEENSN